VNVVIVFDLYLWNTNINQKLQIENFEICFCNVFLFKIIGIRLAAGKVFARSKTRKAFEIMNHVGLVVIAAIEGKLGARQ